MRQVETRLAERGVADDHAWFTCALAVAWPDGPAVVVEGRIDGRWSSRRAATAASATTRSSCREGASQTFGEMEPAAKDAISHRARAFAKLKAALFTDAGERAAARRLCPLALLRAHLPLLRLQRRRATGAARPSSRRWPRPSSPTWRRQAALTGPAPAGLDLLRRRHAVADGPGLGGADDRDRPGGCGRRPRRPSRSALEANPTDAEAGRVRRLRRRRGAAGCRWACRRWTTTRWASSAATIDAAEALPRRRGRRAPPSRACRWT